MTSVVAVVSGHLHDGTPQKAALAICGLGVMRLVLHLLLHGRPRPAPTAPVALEAEMAPRLRDEDGSAAEASGQAIVELQEAHAAARADTAGGEREEKV